MKKTTLSVLITILLLMAVVLPASAITDGELDGEGHPHVVLLLMDVEGEPAYRCSGTLLSPTVLLTAGHCASNFPDPDYTGMRIFTESDVDNGDNTYPYAGGPNSIEAVFWAAHPDYETDAFLYHDVGIVILEEPGLVGLDVYGALPVLDQLDGLETGKKFGQYFTSVGYGLQASYPENAPWENQADRVRMVTNPFLINATGFVNPFSMLLSNNHSTGGTCFGDSGGPNFLGAGEFETNIVAGVTSFGMNLRCAGTGGVYRMDQASVLEFVGFYYP